MKLTIPKHPLYKVDFVRWLLTQVQCSLLRGINVKKLTPIATYINENIVPITPNQLKAVLVKAITTLQITEHQFHYSIDINQKIKYKSIPVAELCRIVNYGCVGVRGTQLFSDIYSFYLTNLRRMYNRYSFL